jgi:hypothetical protein
MDRREEILLRLLSLAAAVEGIVKTARNTTEFPEQLRPAAVLFDGGEGAPEEMNPPRGRSIDASRVMVMTPQLVILLGEDEANVGSEINVLRARLLRTIQTDTTLAALTFKGVGVAYLGCDTNLDAGRGTEAEMSFSYAIPYVLRFSELADVTA